MDPLDIFQEQTVAHHGIASLLMILVILATRSAALRALSRSSLDARVQLQWRVQIRNVTLVVIVLGTVVIWAEELRAVALSLAAVAAALAIATKEFIMCLLGSTMRVSGRSFQAGDRIEVAGVRGDVLDIGPLTTTVLEVGPSQSIHQRSGRIITLPNSVFLTSAVTNETMSHAFVLHALRVPLAKEGDWWVSERRLADIARTHCAQYVEDAHRALTEASPAGIKTTLVSTEPVVYLELPEPGRVELLLRFPTPARLRGRIAQQILRDFLGDRIDPERPAEPREPAAATHPVEPARSS